MASPVNTNWLSELGFENDIFVPDPNYSIPVATFSWSAVPVCPNPGMVEHIPSMELDGSFGDSDGQKEPSSKKRGRSESCSGSSSKACREKLRRDRLNDKFVELGSILEPGRAPKTDKAAILMDAVRMVTQLRGEAQKLKDSNCNLQEKIKELKAEKNELRDEKQRLKGEKEKLEQQIKAINTQPSFMVPPPAIPAAAAFAPQGQAPANKMVSFMGYPQLAMWQFIPSTDRDISQDHVLRPPVA